MIDLDQNATTPLRPEALGAMLPWLRAGANPSSLHLAGQRARAAVDDAREQVAVALGCAAKELVFTSSGTESDNLALRGMLERGGRLVTTSVEHAAVRQTARALESRGIEAVFLGVNARGELDWDAVEREVRPGTTLVSAMWVNNETGVVFPIERLGLLCRERGVPLHVDAVQAFGKLPIDLSVLPVDFLTVSAHKVGGPQGAGALFVRRGRSIEAMQTGGLQERGRRGGTENVAGTVGFGVAAERAEAEREALLERLRLLEAKLREGILSRLSNVRVTGEGAERLPTTLHLCVKGASSEALLMALDQVGVAASSGSACSSGSLEQSAVLRAMGVAPEWARGALRLSMGWSTSEAEVAHAVDLVVAAIRRVRQ